MARGNAGRSGSSNKSDKSTGGGNPGLSDWARELQGRIATEIGGGVPKDHWFTDLQSRTDKGDQA